MVALPPRPLLRWLTDAVNVLRGIGRKIIVDHQIHSLHDLITHHMQTVAT